MSWIRVGALVENLLHAARGSRDPAEPRRPWDRKVRVATLEPWFPVRDRSKIFQTVSLPDLEVYRPHVLSGPAPTLVRLAQAVIGNSARFPELNCGVVAWSGIGRPVLKTAERDLLWLAFQVPVFEEFRGWCGEPLAWECEAHDGFHVSVERAVFTADPYSDELRVAVTTLSDIPKFLPTGLDGRVIDGPCPCGLDGPRLVSLHTRTDNLLRSVAVGA